MKVVRKVKVKNRLGLHARPATVIVKILQTCASDVSLTYKGETINAKSIMSILMLAARKSAQLTITAEGADADQVVEELVGAFDNSFGE